MVGIALPIALTPPKLAAESLSNLLCKLYRVPQMAYLLLLHTEPGTALEIQLAEKHMADRLQISPLPKVRGRATLTRKETSNTICPQTFRIGGSAIIIPHSELLARHRPNEYFSIHIFWTMLQSAALYTSWLLGEVDKL